MFVHNPFCFWDIFSFQHTLSDVTLGLQFELKELKRKQEEEEEERRRQEELARQAAAPPPQSPDQPTDGYVDGSVCLPIYVSDALSPQANFPQGVATSDMPATCISSQLISTPCLHAIFSIHSLC